PPLPPPFAGRSSMASRWKAHPITASAKRCICAIPMETASSCIATALKTNGRADRTAISACTHGLSTWMRCSPRPNCAGCRLRARVGGSADEIHEQIEQRIRIALEIGGFKGGREIEIDTTVAEQPPLERETRADYTNRIEALGTHARTGAFPHHTQEL